MIELSVVPPQAAAVCATFLEQAPPGLVTGLHLRGGIGFGEWVPGQSDVDFVATLSRRPTGDDLAGLRAAHEKVAAAHPEEHFDGPHVLAPDLALDPRTIPDVPCVMHQRFEDESPVHDSVVAWHELARHGITVAGAPIADLAIWTSDEALTRFTRDNLDTYWRRNAEALEAMPHEGEPEEACCYCVLGVARLHHLLVTGEMTTKSAAGHWGLTYYPERFHRVLREALQVREGIPEGGGSEYLDDRAARGRDTADFTAYVVEQGTSRGT